MKHAFASTLHNFQTASGKEGKFFSLPALAQKYPSA
jgi:aconitate hydratase